MKSNCVFRKATVLLLSLMLVTAFFPACLGIPASADSLPKIWLDAGHGGSDPGATNGDRHEADDNLRITLAVGAKLEKIGFSVGYSRTTDVAVDLGDRVPMAAEWGAEYLVSFHRNSAGATATGLEDFYHFKESTDSKSYKLASALQEKTLAATGWVNRGVKADGNPDDGDIGLRITRNCWERGIAGSLIELGFISNNSDNEIYDRCFDAMATALANAISECAGGGKVEDDAVKPYIENGELWLNDCNSMDGFGAVGDTEVFVENDSRGLTSTCMRSSNPTSMSAGVGAMAFYDYSGGNYADMTPYSYVRFSMWCGIDYRTSDRQQDYFQVNFVTQVDGSEQDGYNLNIPASMLRQGWNNDFVFRLSDIGKAVDTADWSRITRMRYTWFNISGGDSVEFNIDNFVAFNAQTPYFVNNELMLTNCDSTDGWWSGSGEMIPEDDSRGKRSMWLKNDESFKDHPAGVGLMAFMDYSSGHRANISYYNRMRFSMWCSIDYATAGRNNDYFQVNLVTTAEGGEQDGYNIHIPARAIHQGWNNEFVIDLTSLSKSIDAADMTKIDRMRFTWFNMSNGDNVSFNIDDFICYNSDDPPTSFEFNDSDPVNPADTTKTFTISDCDSLDSWNIYTGDTLNLDTAKKTQGSASLAAQQTGGLGLYYKFPGTTDFSNVNYITFDFIPAAADMAAAADVRVMLSSRDFINEDNTNSNSWNEQFCDLDVSGFKTMTLKANEWNHVTIPMAGRTATEGFDITKVKKLGIQLLSYYTDERPAGTMNYEWVDNVVAVVGEETPAETTVLCTCERDTEDVFDFCGNSHSVVDGALRVNSESTTASFPGRDGLYNMFYCRVGRNYGDSDYTRSFNYYKYAHVEMLVKPENNNTLIVTHGNEQNNMEWQYLSEVGVTGGRWQRVVMPVSSIGSAVQGETSYGLNDVNLLHIAQTGAGSLLVKNIALVTEQYAAARSSAEQAYINAVNAIGTVTTNSKAAIDAAYAKKADALKYINVQTEEFNTASAALDAAQAAYEALGDATAGDLDGDMRITANDALIVLQHSVGKRTLTDAQKKVSDVNKDGKVNCLDALMILQASVGKRALQ